MSPAAGRVVIVTGIPAAGRSEVVNELLGWLDPKFVTVYGFPEANEVERQRPPLWRYWRSHAAEGPRRHPARRLVWRFPVGSVREPSRHASVVRREVERITRLERMLVADGVTVVKVHLHVGPELQAAAHPGS